MKGRPVYFGDPAEVVRFARSSGLTTTQIVRTLTRAETDDTVKQIAEKYAKILGVTNEEFFRIARGRKGS